ncbi:MULTISPECIES: LapA family protein [unclassified Thermosynechococcus]|uniref:LapA family protein n=1 Tax=unclassified Thermosynechococcus TaxID=2622553 RepID=UPI0019F42844|nr:MULTISPECIES: LapA family protein [unclassified Thermosynechococcus]HIK34730.1 LapA family protein [Thermosynechococcus sp. M98_K2018_005]HIK49169.1 LapA family protein [Thermosynechococcus sp. M55_K2018_012]
MQQLNFLMIFVIGLGLVLFSIQNTDPVSIKFFEGKVIQAPLCIELIVAMGMGAVFAWVFNVWVQVQRIFTIRVEMEARDEQIAHLEADVERYKAALEEQQRLLPSVSSASTEK